MDYSNKLCTTHIITDPAAYRQGSFSFPPWITNISFEITFNDTEAIATLLYGLTFEKKPALFSLTIRMAEDMAAPPEPKWVAYLATLLIHAGYFKVRGNHLLFLDTSRSKTENYRTLLAGLLQRLAQLGFDKILMARPGEKEDRSVLQLISFEAFIEVRDIPVLLLQPDRIVHAYLKVINPENSPGLITAFEEKLSHTDEQSRNMILLFNDLREKLYEREGRIESLKESLQSKEDYLKFLLYTPVEGDNTGGNPMPLSDLQKIRNFYHYEYEILPLWYKRFGHIIKVISGKRTFKSLFNDDVKKYKS